MIDLANITTGLAEASFRGVPFYMPRASSETGRRVERVFFPGKNRTAFQDTGALDGAIRIAGLVTGDDYVDQARQLQAAFRRAGPGLLVHPWLGQIQVVLTDPVTINFDWTELRVARFQATFAPYTPPRPPDVDTLGAVNASVSGVQQASADLLDVILAPAALTLALVGAAENFCAAVAGVWTEVAGAAGPMAAAIAADIATLGAVTGLATDATYPASIYAALAPPAADLAATSATLLPSAIGPGDVLPSTTPLDARVTTRALLSATTQIVALAASPGAVAGLVLAAAALAVSSAADAAGDIAYSSQTEAQTQLAKLTAAIDTVALLATTLAPAQPIAAGTVWRNLQVLRGRLAADIHALLGRLPVVQSFQVREMPLWLIAQSIFGDDPSKLLASYIDLASRNAVINPGLVPPGTIEALVA